MRCNARLFGALVLMTLLAAVTDTAAGQVADSTKVFTATLIGRVTDTSGSAVTGAEVVVTRTGDSAVVGTATSNKKGSVTLKRLPVGTAYIVTARKIGYGAARGTIQLHAGDTLYVDFELPPLAVVLAPITVTARRNRLSIAADQFNPKHYRDALSLLVERRRDMLGDPEQCPLPDSVLGGPGRDSVVRAKLGRFSLSNDPRAFKDIRKRPWLDTLQYHSYVVAPDLPYVQQVYVNGVRTDWPKVQTTVWSANGKPVQVLRPVPGRSVVEALRDIPADQIAEIHYADCWDRSVPFYKQYALYVTLKPPSREVQDSILRAITKHDSASH